MLRPHSARVLARPLLAVMALFTLLAALLIPTAAPAGAASGRTDLSVSVTGPQKVQGDGEYEYTVVASNSKGPSAADGAVVTVSTEGLSQLKAVSCGSPSGGARCPVAPLAQPWEMTLPALPVGGSVVFKLSVTMKSLPAGGTGSGAVVAEIAPPAGVSDDDTSTNRSVQGQTVSPSPTLDVSLKAVSADPVAMGEVAIHRFTWENKGIDAVAATTIHFSGPSGVQSTWRYNCVEGADGVCPAGLPTQWKTIESGALGGWVPDVSMPAGSSVDMQLEVSFAAARCGEASQRYTIVSDLTTRGPLGNVGSPGRVASAGTLSGFEPCPTVNLTAQIFDVAPQELSQGEDPHVSLSGRAVFTNAGERATSARVNLLVSDRGYLSYTTAARCVASGGAVCPAGTESDGPLGSWQLEMPPGSTLTWILSGVARQTSCSDNGDSSVSWHSSIASTNPADQNLGSPESSQGGHHIRGLSKCSYRTASVAMEWDSAWTRLGEDAHVKTTFTNTSDQETAFYLEDAWFNSRSYDPLATILSAVVTCVSDVCPAAYPRGKELTVKGRAGLLDSQVSYADRSVTLAPGESVVTQRVLTIGIDQPRCPVNGTILPETAAGLQAYGPNILGGGGATSGWKVSCHDDTIGVKVNAAAPGAATDVLVEVGNSGAPAREQRVVVALPKDGLFYEEGSSAAASAKNAQSRAAAADCVASEEIACPELSYDADAHTVSFALSDIPVTGTRTVKIPVIMGVKPAGGGKSYRVQAKVESDDQGKGEAAPNNNTAVDTFAVNNAPAPVSLALTVAGAAPTKDLKVAGTMSCRFQGSQELSGVIKSGTKALTIKGAAVYPGDECSLELNTVTGAEWVSGQSQAAVAVTGPVAWKATLRVAESEPGTDEGTQNASGTDEGTVSDDASGTADGSGTSADAGSETSANANADNGGAGTDSSVNADASAGANPENGSDPTAGANPDAAADEAGADPGSNAGSGSDADPSGEPDNHPDSKPSKDPVDVLGTDSRAAANADANANDSAQGDDLPQTGGNAALPLTLAGLLAAAGALLLVQTRRRHARGASSLPGRHTAG